MWPRRVRQHTSWYRLHMLEAAKYFFDTQAERPTHRNRGKCIRDVMTSRHRQLHRPVSLSSHQLKLGATILIELYCDRAVVRVMVDRKGLPVLVAKLTLPIVVKLGIRVR